MLRHWRSARLSWAAEAAGNHGFFYPQDYVVAGATLIVAQVVVEADGFYAAGLQQLNGLIRSILAQAAFGRGAFVIQKNVHDRTDVMVRIEHPQCHVGHVCAWTTLPYDAWCTK